MSNSIVPAVYKWVIDDVIEKMSIQFAHLGVDESVLQELQGTWEQKIIASKVADFPQLPLYNTADAYLNEDYEGDYENGQQYGSNAANLATLASQSYRLNQTDGADDERRSSCFNQTDGPSDTHDKLEFSVSSTTTHLSNEPQLTTQQIDEQLEKRWKTSNVYRNMKKLKQTDGADDDEEEEEEDDDNEERDEAHIGSDLDDEEEEEEIDTENIILCQYDKVTRIKNKWKCQFRDGIITIDGKDYLFNKATGEFIW